MKNMGIEERRIPRELRDIVVKKSKKGPLGAIVVKKITGLESNTASRVLKRFEENVGGKDDIAEKLEAVAPDLNKDLKVLLNIIKNPNKWSLARIVAESHAEPVALMKAYAQGAIELGKIDAAIEAHRNLPAIIKELYKLVLTKQKVCQYCGGTGSLHKRNSDHKESLPCKWCQGKGNWEEENEHKEFAINKLLEVTKLVGKEPPQINVNTQVGVKVDGAGNGSFMERIMATTDEVLYAKQRSGKVIEGEVINRKLERSLVPPSSNSSESE